jgi:hypothetical protein
MFAEQWTGGLRHGAEIRSAYGPYVKRLIMDFFNRHHFSTILARLTAQDSYYALSTGSTASVTWP